MIELSPDRIAASCAATIVAGDTEARSATDFPERAVIDSREVRPGDLFFGLRGAQADGGEFAASAIEAGAWGVVVESVKARSLEPVARSARVLGTRDPLGALQGLARAWSQELRGKHCRVVAITGSTGKTSTKDILVALLGSALEGHARGNRENFNTEIGLPLTVLEAPASTRALVLEMAMRGMGQIGELARIAVPAVGVITNIGPVHLELVGTIEHVAEAKAELIAELPSKAACVVPAAEEALHPHLRSDVRVITFASCHGEGSDPLGLVAATANASAAVRALSVEPTDVGLRAHIVAGGESAEFEFNFRQAHNLTNALAAIGVVHALGVPLADVAPGAGRVSFSGLRGEEVETPRGVLVINDCYNANPTSMRAALDHLVLRARQRGSPRTVAIVGDMKELGEGSASYHRELGEHAARLGVDVLVAVGEQRGAYGQGFADERRLHEASDAQQAARLAGELVEPGDVVLVKASRSVGLERVVDALDSAGAL